MKKPNSISEIYLERDKEIISLFRKAKEVVEYPTTMEKICIYISTMPTSCYYLADSTAYRYVCKRLKGIIPSFGRNQKNKEMLFEAFYKDFIQLKESSKYKELSNSKLVDIVLNYPAPHLGLSPRYIQTKISEYYRGKSPLFK